MPSVTQFVEEVARAIQESDEEIGKAGLKVSSVTLSVATTLTREGGGGFKISVVEIEGGGTLEDSQKVTVEFKPVTREALFRLELDAELKEAIETITAMEKAASEVQDTLGLSTGEVTLKLGMTARGKVKVFFGAGASRGYAHEATIKLSKIT